jgi:hypothetical protein
VFSIGGGTGWCEECSGTHLHTSGTKLVGSGTRARETRSVEPFTRIEIQSSADADVRVGPGEAALEVIADDNLIDRVQTRVTDGVLVIGMASGSYSLKTSPRVVVRVPSLEGLVIAGSGDVRVEGLAGARFEGVIRGSGDMVLLGAVDEVELAIEGSGDVDAFGLEARSVRARIAGSGDLDVLALEELDAEVRGSGDVRYRGQPASCRTRVLGSGSIERS